MSSPDPEAPADTSAVAATSPDPKRQLIAKALPRYRLMAWVTGVWLLVLCVEMVLKYIVGIDYPWFTWIGVTHGAFYMLYVFFSFDLAIKARWPLGKTVGVLLAGTVPLAGFIVEHFQTKRLKAQFAL